jgi:hypothetical protein
VCKEPSIHDIPGEPEAGTKATCSFPSQKIFIISKLLYTLPGIPESFLALPIKRSSCPMMKKIVICLFLALMVIPAFVMAAGCQGSGTGMSTSDVDALGFYSGDRPLDGTGNQHMGPGPHYSGDKPQDGSGNKHRGPAP